MYDLVKNVQDIFTRVHGRERAGPLYTADDLSNSQNCLHKTDISMIFACNWTTFWSIVSTGTIFLLLDAILKLTKEHKTLSFF